MIEALHKAMSGVPTFVQDSEMGDELWYIRAVALLTGISTDRIKNEVLTDEENALMESANNYLKKLPVVPQF